MWGQSRSNCFLHNSHRQKVVNTLIWYKLLYFLAYWSRFGLSHCRTVQNEELIEDEKLNGDLAKKYISRSLKREYASENGTELNELMPKMSPLNPNYLPKKRSIFEKISAFVEKFKGVGGVI